MKVKISYESDEKREALILRSFIQKLLPGAMMHRSNRSMCLTTKNIKRQA